MNNLVSFGCVDDEVDGVKWTFNKNKWSQNIDYKISL